jgi:hypothetical protein
MVEMPTNPALLKKMATRTGGTFFSATDPKALETSFAQILDGLDRSLLEDTLPLRRRIPLAPPLVLPASLLLVGALWLAMTRAGSVP